MDKRTEKDKIEEKVVPRKRTTSKVTSETVEAKRTDKTASTKTTAKKTTAKKSTTKTTTAKKTTTKKAPTTKTTRKNTTKSTTKTAEKAPRKRSVREVERKQKIEAEKIESREFYKRNRKSDSKRSLRIARAGKRRILRANRRAELVEALGKMRARNQASKGKYAEARKTSRKAIERSDRIIQKAITKNAKLYGKFERKRFIKELVETTTAEINEEFEKDESNSNEWNEKHGDNKIAKVINGLAKADISVKKFTAKADMKVASLYAKTANSMGFGDHAKLVIEEISMAAEERVRYSRVDNEKARASADRVFGFAERRRKNLEAAESFIENLSRNVITGVAEGFTHLNDDLATWIEDIEYRKVRPMPQRNYNLAFASGGYVSNSFQVRSRNVLNFVEGSLNGKQVGGRYQTNQRDNIRGTFDDGR